MHAEAADHQEASYVDPETGFQVVTELGHRGRGKCCGCGCLLPIWHRPYDELLDEWVASGASAQLTAAPCGDFGGVVKVGERFSPEFVSPLPQYVDRFGEHGEFHTLVSW